MLSSDINHAEKIAGQVAEMIFWKRGGNGRKSLLLMVTLPLTVFLVKVHSHYSNEVGDVPMIDVGDTAEQHRRMERIRSRCDEKRFEKIAQRKRSQSETDTPVFVTEPKNHIFYCQIPKVATTAWMHVFAGLNGLRPEEVSELWKSDRLHKKVLEEFSSPSNVPQDEDSFRFLFVRHPFDRLVAAYHDKFVLRRENSFIQPLIAWMKKRRHQSKFLTRMMDAISGEKSRANKTEERVNFSNFTEFVQMEVEEQKSSYGSLHWKPYVELCDLCKTRYDFVGKLETLEEDFQLLQNTFPGDLDQYKTFFQRDSLKLNSVGGGALSKRYFSQLSRRQILSLYRTFKEDFDLFGYDYPIDFINVGAK